MLISECVTLGIENQNARLRCEIHRLTDYTDFEHSLRVLGAGQQVKCLHERITAEGHLCCAVVNAIVGSSLLLLKLEQSKKQAYYSHQQKYCRAPKGHEFLV